MKSTPNQTLETNCRTAAPPLRSIPGGNADTPFTLDLAYPAAVAELCDEQARRRSSRLELPIQMGMISS